MDTDTPPTHVLLDGVAKNVRGEIARRMITTAQVALWTGLTAQTVRSKLAGRKQWTLTDLENLAQGLGLSPFDLVRPPT